MSNRGKFVDYAPFIKVAGVTTAIEGATCDNSLRQDLYLKANSTTPEHIKKYRKSLKEEPGVKQLHYGVYNDPKDYEDLIHGMKTLDSDHVNNCIKGSNLPGIKNFINNIQENKYARNNREPLGKSLMRNYNFPEKTTQDNFKFGIPTTGFYNSKDLLYTCPNLSETQDVKKLYNKTHGLSDPGEQKDRKYNWPVDKNSHVFGKPEQKEFDGTKKSLEMDLLHSQYPNTKIVDKRLEDFRQATGDVVGRGKFRGTLHPGIDENIYVFGEQKQRENWNVAKWLHGVPDELSQKHLESDPDLGKTLLHRSKLKNQQMKETDSTKIFGVPSIRYDLKKTKSSICNPINYGDEKDAFDLLYPNPHVFRNVDDPDFEEKIDKDSLRELLSRNNYNFPEEEYNLIYEITLKNFPDGERKVSFKGFIQIMKNLKRELMKYRTLIS